MDKEVFENSFYKHVVAEIQAFPKERGLPQKALLLMDDVPSDPRE
jgi:hypothetical protein